MALPVGALIGLGTSLLGGLFGAGQRRQARRLEEQTERPIAEVNENLLENVSRAEQRAQIGLPQEQYNTALQNIQRSQNAGLRQASRLGGIGSIASILRASNDATGSLDIADANARLIAEQQAMQQRGILAQEQNRVWDWNERQNYLQILDRIQSLRGAGNRNIAGAIGSAAQIGIGLFGGQQAGIGGATGAQQVLPNVASAQTLGVQTPTNLTPGYTPLNFSGIPQDRVRF